MTAGLRADIAEQYSLRGKLPTSAQLGLDGDDFNVSGRYVESVAYGGEGVISVTFGDNSALDDAQMDIEPDGGNPGNGWTCSWAGTSDQNNWLPAGCRADD
ncbi:pilin [Halomonas meridiana]|nr:pilin [Halomonas meridiana]